MPKVPRYGDPQVRTAPTPNVRFNTDTPAGAFAPPEPIDFSGVQKIASAIWEEEKDKADQIAVLDAENKLAELETNMLYDPKTGILNRKGKDAFSAPEEVETAWEQAVSDIGSGLHTDRQRLAFSRSSSSRKININRQVQRHVATEMETYDNEVTESFIINERNTAVASYNDPARVQLSIDRQRTAIADFAKRNGTPPEKVEALTVNAVSKTHMGVMNRMLANGQDRTASAYYTKHKAEVSGADVENIEKSLQEGSTRGESQRQADAIVAKGGSRSAALDEVRKIDDPKLRDAVHERVNSFFDERREIQRENQNDLYLRATNMIEGKRGTARRMVPSHIWSQLDLGQRAALERRAEGDDVDIPNNDSLFLSFLDLTPEQTGRLTQAEFEGKYWGKFDKQHRERAATKWAASRDLLRTGKMDPKLANITTLNDQFVNTLKTVGYISADKTPAKYSKIEAKGIAIMEQAINREVAEFQESKGKIATVAERQEIIDKHVKQKVFVQRFGKDKEVPVSLIEENQRKKSYVPHKKIPDIEKNAIHRIIQSKGKRSTNSKIERAYAAMLLGDMDLFNAIIIE